MKQANCSRLIFIRRSWCLCCPVNLIKSRISGRALCGPLHVHICKWETQHCFLFRVSFTIFQDLPPAPITQGAVPRATDSQHVLLISPAQSRAHIWREDWAHALRFNKENLHVGKILFSLLMHPLEITNIMSLSWLCPGASGRIKTATLDILCLPLTGLHSQPQQSPDCTNGPAWAVALVYCTREDVSSSAGGWSTGFSEWSRINISMTKIIHWHFWLPQIKIYG